MKNLPSMKMHKQNEVLIHKSNDVEEAYSKINLSYKSIILHHHEKYGGGG